MGGGGGGAQPFNTKRVNLTGEKSTMQLFACLFFEKRRFLIVKSRPRSGSRPCI